MQPPVPQPSNAALPPLGTLPIRAGDLTVTGFSLGGVETAVVVPELRLAIDVGRGRQDVIRCDHLALTHTHMDHAGGIPYVLALRQLYGMAPPTIYVPAQMAEAFGAMLAAWEKVQRYPLAGPIIAAEPGERYPIGRDTWLVPFRTYHPVPSNGYVVIKAKKRLKAEFAGRAGPELAELKRGGVAIDEVIEHALLAVTGDTLVEVVEKQPHILEVDTLVMECTFLDARKQLADARAGGHVHMTELMPLAEAFRNRQLVLSHFSQIYRPDEVPALLAPFAARCLSSVLPFPMEPAAPGTTCPA